MRNKIRLMSVVVVLLAVSAPAFAQQPAFDFSSLEADEAAAVLAGGCFWCMEPPYDKLPGVVETISGYTGGSVENPTYQQVVRNNTGHYEAVLVVYRPEEISYEELLEVFWVNIDPLDDGGQFCDRGSSYRSGIFYRTSEQRRIADASKTELESSGRLRGTVVTEILPAEEFYVAEEYHQDYYRKNPIRYRTYRTGCGRDARLRQLWGSDAPS
ncbi:MAG: peptide-methionine (S)-S-oxide reductase MsrA [Alkalispirochaeta sp.]